MTPEELMRLAIECTRQGMAQGQSPFGCAIADDSGLLAVSHNTVLATNDSTAHAEVNAIRAACERQRAPYLSSAIAVTTCEPCPMCMAALHWARVETVYYGASIEDAQKAGFRELMLSAQDVCRLGKSSVQLVPNLLTEECAILFDEWKRHPQAKTY